MSSSNASLPITTLVASAPLFLSFQLKQPPDSLHGTPFILLWTWGVLATVAVPLLVAAEVVYCVSILVTRRGRPRPPLTWHVVSLLIATLAYVVFRVARLNA